MIKEIGDKQLRLTGKAWEVRHALRAMARGAGQEGPLLHAYLDAQAPERARGVAPRKLYSGTPESV
ncbi:Z-ring formation inhibitor MciZ [Paenibacillus sp. IB182496]|uniref:Z-ring formation inhibitor MciZ n=1 Tax=Paenibacillus sabuli TaxID=2772509 RepID=A0A927GU40_9BACL|nr:Z-ring formation inhibitor MciZ [Paenibacillus sabuli]MBD2847322.1 Z-ring formation inhibitor MciZ [Paenibacillus sabuli]